jgi:P-type Cu+ transporter
MNLPSTNRSSQGTTAQPVCYHCGDACANDHIHLDEKVFCCEGCKLVFEILDERDMCRYYDLEQHPGISLKGPKETGKYAYLDQPEIKEQLLDFQDEAQAKVTFFIPQIHCASCIWLLENLYKLHPGVVRSRVDFLKKEAYLTYQPQALSLRELVGLLASIGYEPDISLGSLKPQQRRRNDASFYYKLGVAGFCFGNIMLMSFPEYLGLDPATEGNFRQFFGLLNLLLALPVFLYSASLFYRSAWQGLRKNFLNIDIPITLGILALFLRSSYEILMLNEAGYMDSLAALVFFLLVGRWFQNRTYDTLSFDRDYTAYFPISTTRKVVGEERSTPITDLAPGDTILVRNQELVPADALLLSGEARIDYSFVTGEAEPVTKQAGELIYAGGRQAGQAIELTLVKDVSQSYLTQLWNHEAFEGEEKRSVRALADRLGKRFTLAVLSIALIAGAWWYWEVGIGMAVNVATAVLIVACPCALALTSPITLGNAMRLLGKHRFYLKNTAIIERMASISHLVFDKTGTITHKGSDNTALMKGSLEPEERARVAALARQSTHPMSRAISRCLGAQPDLLVEAYEETPGQGIRGEIAGQHIWLGARRYVVQAYQGSEPLPEQPGTYLLLNGRLAAIFTLPHHYRKGLRAVLSGLGSRFGLSLISGDNDREQKPLQAYFPAGSAMHFNQSPQDKLAYIEHLQQAGEQVLMVGDGLNDAGALKLSDVGIAITEDVDTFSPACDAILDARNFGQFEAFMQYARRSVRLIKAGLVLSLLYNLVGLSIAVQGLLSPVIAAILMPLSSVTVVIFGVVATRIAARKLGQKSQ